MDLCQPSPAVIAASVIWSSCESRPSVATGASEAFIDFENCNVTCNGPGAIPWNRVSTTNSRFFSGSADEGVQCAEYMSFEKEPSAPGENALTDSRIGGPAAQFS